MIGYKSIDAASYHIAERCKQVMQVYDITNDIVYDILKEIDTNDIIMHVDDAIYRFTDKGITTEAALRLFDVDIDRLRVDPLCADVCLEEVLALSVAEVDICQMDIVPLSATAAAAAAA